MKYIRKIVWLLIGIVFLASVVIGIGVIFAVKNVNVDLNSYTYPDWESMTEEERQSADAKIGGFKDSILGKYRGAMIGFVDEEELAELFKDSDYVFAGLEKVYPCTLNVTLNERRETFATENGDGKYKTYDAEGRFLADNADGFNVLDGSPDIIVNGAMGDGDIAAVADISRIIAKPEYFGSLRPVVNSVQLISADKVMIFSLRCGIDINISDYGNLSEVKVAKAYQKFLSLTAEGKLSGTIVAAVQASNGEVVVEHIPT